MVIPRGPLEDMHVDRPLFGRRMFAKRAPSWVKCELCERQGTRLPDRFVIAADRNGPVEKSALVLLCADCSALVEGAIDAAEWKRRTKFCST